MIYGELNCRSNWSLKYIRSWFRVALWGMYSHMLQIDRVWLRRDWPPTHITRNVIQHSRESSGVTFETVACSSVRFVPRWLRGCPRATVTRSRAADSWTRVVLLHGWDQREGREWKVTSLTGISSFSEAANSSMRQHAESLFVTLCRHFGLMLARRTQIHGPPNKSLRHR